MDALAMYSINVTSTASDLSDTNVQPDANVFDTNVQPDANVQPGPSSLGTQFPDSSFNRMIAEDPDLSQVDLMNQFRS
jgi:hypothetical protein